MTLKKYLFLQPQCAKCANATSIGNAYPATSGIGVIFHSVFTPSSLLLLRFTSSIRSHGDGGAGARGGGGGVNGVFQEIEDHRACCLLPSLQILTRDGFCF